MERNDSEDGRRLCRSRTALPLSPKIPPFEGVTRPPFFPIIKDRNGVSKWIRSIFRKISNRNFLTSIKAV